MSDRQVHLRLDSTVDDRRFARALSVGQVAVIFRDVAVFVDEKNPKTSFQFCSRLIDLRSEGHNRCSAAADKAKL